MKQVLEACVATKVVTASYLVPILVFVGGPLSRLVYYMIAQRPNYLDCLVAGTDAMGD